MRCALAIWVPTLLQLAGRVYDVILHLVLDLTTKSSFSLLNVSTQASCGLGLGCVLLRLDKRDINSKPDFPLPPVKTLTIIKTLQNNLHNCNNLDRQQYLFCCKEYIFSGQRSLQLVCIRISFVYYNIVWNKICTRQHCTIIYFLSLFLL